ncbi:MAG: hypothetical protein GY842_21375 [bacterium]|nr:hypothetical protein [bacterium]
MANNVKPTPIALVVCDNIYEEPGGKVALVGLFNNIVTSELPVTHPRLAVFASVTGLRKGSQAKLEILHGESESAVVAAQGPFPDDVDPLSVVDMSFVFNNVTFEEEGTYFIRFWGNDHVLMMRPFQVCKRKKKVG